MWKRLRTRKGIAITTAISVAVAGFGAGYYFGAFDGLANAGASQTAAEIPVSADAYTSSQHPDTNLGSRNRLLAGGGESGVSVTYLRFAVTGAQAASPLTLRLPVAKVVDNELVELSTVSPQWSEKSITAAEAPPMGDVLDSRRADVDKPVVALNIPAGALRAGKVAFAVTSPSASAAMSFHAQESGVYASSLRTAQSAESDTRPPPRQLNDKGACPVGEKLVPDCGALMGVAPGAHSGSSKTDALRDFEGSTGRNQHIYHSYHRGEEMFPTQDEIAVATEPQKPRILFLNWKPRGVSWAEIAAGDKSTDAYLDKLAAHINNNFGDRQFFFTVHHEPEDNVRDDPDSGFTAKDYAAMFAHVVKRLKSKGVSNMISVMVYMAYLKWTQKEWHSELYPGDDVVDWVAWDAYGYSDPGYGHGDFTDIVNRQGDPPQQWPGFYNWAVHNFPDKPLMVAEWGVWYSKKNPDHQAKVFRGAASQMAHYPRLKALVYFESSNAEGRDSRININPRALDAYRNLTDSRRFSVNLKGLVPRLPTVAGAAAVSGHKRSMTMAMPWPPPTHMVSRP